MHWPTRLHLATPPPRSLPLLDLLARARRSTESRLSRELILLGLLLITGLVLVPLAIWVVGNRALGSYTHGSNPNAGPLALLGDFYAGLTSGAPSYWVVALGPLLIVLFIRVVFALLKAGPPTQPPDRAPVERENKSPRRIEPRL